MAKKKSAARPSAWYALRRTLPPWRFEATLKELIDCVPRYRVDEVIVKVDTEEFSHGQPSIAWAKKYQKRLFETKEALRKIGVVYSLNPWITVGHNDRGRDSRKTVPGFESVVGHNGVVSKACACPLGPNWRAHIAKLWTLYAKTEPHVMWVEDDIRTFNHNPVRFGCFCPLHLKRFGEIVGKRVTREQVVAALLKPGKPHAWRAKWLQMQGEIMVDTVGFLAKTVHATSPATSIGLMSSGPRVHDMEGRQWLKLADALADGQPLYSRPPMGNYHEASMRGFYYSHDSIKITRHVLPPGTIEQTEVENVPFTRYANSIKFTFMEMAISFAYGSHGVTMNLFDHAGTPMEDDPHFGKMLGEKKAYLNGLSSLAQKPGVFRGVQLLHHDDSGKRKRLQRDAPYHELITEGAEMMEALESHGIPTTFDDSEVVAVSGQVLRAFSDAQIAALLGKTRGLLLDGVAAGVLAERGFGDDIGLKSIDAPVHIDTLGGFGVEEFHHKKFGGADGKYLTTTVPFLGGRPSIAVAKLKRSAVAVSHLVDPDTKRHHVCSYAIENRNGGRVFVHLYDLQSAFGVPFCHPFRAEQLHGAVRWLSRDRPSVLVRGDGVYPLAFRKDIEDRTLVGMFNLTLDPWPSVEFELADSRKPVKVELLKKTGRWKPDKAITIAMTRGRVTLRYEKPVACDEPVFMALTWG